MTAIPSSWLPEGETAAEHYCPVCRFTDCDCEPDEDEQ